MRTFAILLVFVFAVDLGAQKNTVYFELLGNGPLGSVNYERQLTRELGLSARIGAGYVLGLFDSGGLSIPISLQYQKAVSSHGLMEFGLGSTFAPERVSDYCFSDPSKCEKPKWHINQLMFLNIGYRKHFGDDKNWMWKFSLTPAIAGNAEGEPLSFGFFPWIGFSFGKRF